MNKNGLQLNAITFSLPHKSIRFFENLNLFFESGKVHFVRGHNGSGKSTLLRVIQGQINQNELLSGSYTLDNLEYTIQKNNASLEYSSHVKQVVQQVDSMVVKNMTVAQNLRLARIPHFARLVPFLLNEKSDSILTAAGINDTMHVADLSGGQRQLLATVMAYWNSGRVLLLDEPTAALDDKNSDLVMKFVGQFAQEKNLIVVIVCHDVDIVTRYCTGLQIKIEVGANETRSIKIV